MSTVDKKAQTVGELWAEYPASEGRYVPYWVAKSLERERNQLKSKLAETKKQLDFANHNAKVLLKVADNEIAKLKAIVYCQCDEPDFNKFGMDNQCAKCGKVIEDHPLNCEKESRAGTTASSASCASNPKPLEESL